ncbi:MAG: chemotaxis protein CheW [Spirochaetaceae bacterium]|jgi:purine-binding chemotaxis protein CheW|nr:chemotaxis protein CheW [Spirochaetaceae bacterium]
MKIKDLATVNAELQEKKDLIDNADYKMVTFSLAGKDYGVDIMNVKEIAKADKFTYVPNAASFVRGVYNLRGDIIPIIDLRTFFHLPIEDKNDGWENMLILHIDDRVYGTIVDRIDKVVSIHSSLIQPAHPIFGDINAKYIGGVVENKGSLYIILDVVHIFSQNQEEKQASRDSVEGGDGAAYFKSAASAGEAEGGLTEPSVTADDLGFIKEGLAALNKFYSSPVNEDWVAARLVEWAATRSKENIQLKNTSDADAYLEPFFSPCNGKLWTSDYAYAVKALLPDLSSNNIQVWNVGCGKGYETFSLACILKLRYPDGHIKIWANDNDIMAIANAPNMVFEMTDVPDYCQTFISKGRTGYIFNASIKDSIVFEYHDVTNVNTLPELDIVVCRDTLSFLTPDGQKRVFKDISEKLKSKGIVFLGTNETMLDADWKAVGKNQISAFIRIEKN